jgi:hypothetical protein
MESESERSDPKDVLKEKLLDVAAQIYVARVDSPTDHQSRRVRTNYGPGDAIAEAATLMTLTLAAGRAETAFEEAALRTGSPSIWPADDADDDRVDAPVTGRA